MSFWNIVWLIVISYVFFAYLMVLFSVCGDLFRDKQASGVAKALWVLALIVFPFLSVIVYMITRGSGMAERSERQVKAAQAEQESYIKTVAGTTTPVDQVMQAKALLDAGAISQTEYDTIKTNALTSQR
jgi:ABC-type dipeptide/oligopeptide/nickel transport system permease subunit